MRSPRMCSTNFQGPVPTGCRSAASSSAVSMYCFEWIKAEEANNPWVTLLPKATKGFSKRKVIVYGSSISMLLIRRNSGASLLADPSLAIVAKVNLTSSAVSSPMAVMELDVLPQVEASGPPLLQHLSALGEHGTESTGFGVTTEQVFHHWLEYHVLSTRVQVW